MKNVYTLGLVLTLVFGAFLAGLPAARASDTSSTDAESSVTNKLFLMGGMNSSGQLLNDVYTSDNAATWTSVLTNAPWAGRVQAEAVYFQNKIWVMGGFTGVGQYGLSNEIWNSTNGIDWNLVKAGPHWSPRTKFSLVVFQNKMWVMGGNSGIQANNDIWNTTDGINWTQVQSTSRVWEPRQALVTTVFDPGTGKRLYVIAGDKFSGGIPFNDVWSTGNGVSWRRETAQAVSGTQLVNLDQAVVYNDHGTEKIFLVGCILGGGTNLCLQNVWSSTDGASWTLGSVAPWGQLHGVFPFVFNAGNGNKIYITGGVSGANTVVSDVWSFNGTNWNQVTTTPGWSARMGHLVVKVPSTFGL